jgi:thiol-disulfide isomerase/thioredoxin
MRAISSVILLFSALSVSLAAIVNLKNSSIFYNFAERQSKWLIEFYAPWCHHCDKLLPILEKVSDYAKDSMPIGKVDGTVLGGIAKEMKVTKYPTILYKHNSVTGVYDGPRTFLGLTQFIDRMNHGASWYFLEEIKEIGEKMFSLQVNNSFLFQFPSTCNSGYENPQCQKFYHQMENLSERTKFHSTLFYQFVDEPRDINNHPLLTANQLSTVTPQPILHSLCKYDLIHHQATDARLLYCLRADDLLHYNNNNNNHDNEEEDSMLVDSIASYIKLNDYPLVNEFEAHNFKALAHHNKTMFLILLNTLEPLHSALQHFAGQHIAHSETILFGYLYAKKWHKFCKLHRAIAPSLLIIDHQDERHALVSLLNTPTESYPQILEEVWNDLAAGRIHMEDTAETHTLFSKLLHRLERYGYMTYLLFALPILFFAISFLFPHPNKKAKQH